MKPELDVVSVRKIRLDAAPPVNGSPSARVTFELHNESVRSLTDLVLALWLVEPPSRNGLDGERVVVAAGKFLQSYVVRTRTGVGTGPLIGYCSTPCARVVLGALAARKEVKASVG